MARTCKWCLDTDIDPYDYISPWELCHRHAAESEGLSEHQMDRGHGIQYAEELNGW